MAKKAIINGVNGQDGAYLAELLLGKGYKVFGGIRSIETSDLEKLRHLGIIDQLEIFELGLTDAEKIKNSICSINPDEFYNLAALSSVSKSWDYPEETFEANAIGVLRILEAIKTSAPKCKYFQASSSEMFGDTSAAIQDEETEFQPRNPYGISKLAAYFSVKSYRESFGIFASNGILFNHESPLRPKSYVSRKITATLAEISMGLKETLKIGNLDIERDWGYAPDYVKGMFDLLQHHDALDLVFATGETHSVREFIEMAAKHVGIDIEWSGNGYKEAGIDKNSGKRVVEVDSSFYRPVDIRQTKGNSQKAKRTINWSAKLNTEELAQKMINHDIVLLKNR